MTAVLRYLRRVSTLAMLLTVAAPASSQPAPAPAPHAAAQVHGAGTKRDSRSSNVLTLAGLIAGNERFVSGRPLHPRAGRDVRQQLALGQKPRAIVLSCADSRVPPELVFDQGLGDLFVVRVAGQALDASSTASIEYAIEHLGATLVVVMGHQSCGAVKAALTAPPGQGGSPDLNTLLDEIRPAIAAFGAPRADDKTFDRPVRANVDAMSAGLTRRSAIIREAVEHGTVAIIPAIYELASGTVSFWDAPLPVAADH